MSSYSLLWSLAGLGLFLNGASARADDCEAMRLDAAGRSMSHVDFRPQGDLNLSAAIVASELVDAYRFSHKPPVGDRDHRFQTSAIGTAFTTSRDLKQSYKETLDETGLNECSAAESIKAHQACDARVIKTDPALADDLNFLAESYNVLDSFDQKKPDVDKASSLVQKACHLTEQDLLHRGLMSNTDALISLLRSQTQKAESHAASAFGKNCRSANLKSVNFGQCGGPKLNPLDPDIAKNAILKRLNGPAPIQPIAIDICENVLTEGRSYTGYSKPLPGGKDDKGDEDGYHTAADCVSFSTLVIGKRLSRLTGKCQLLIQNSWGFDCKKDDYAKEWLRGCEYGKVWVDIDALTRNMEDLNFLD